MEAISNICSTYGVRLIEDASHAIGASYNGSKVGANCYCDITIFSFHPVKIITTAEGGLATTNDPKLAQRMDLYRSHGITRDASLMDGDSEGPWYYQQVELGFNYRMTELQAALGISQLDRLDDFVSKRNELAQRYDELLEGLPLHTPKQDPKCVSARHLYIVRLDLDKLRSSRRDIFCALRDAGIGVNVHYIPIHLQPYYQGLGFNKGDFPKAEAFYQQAVSLPLYPNLSETDQDYIVSTIKNLLLGT
jgi:dTDP-4-amino-4,6-dideoxygalactose transaminase